MDEIVGTKEAFILTESEHEVQLLCPWTPRWFGTRSL